jgi:hypothetical protein
VHTFTDPCCALCIPEINKMHLILIGMQNRTLRPYLAAIDRILISVMCVNLAKRQAGAGRLRQQAVGKSKSQMCFSNTSMKPMRYPWSC